MAEYSGHRNRAPKGIQVTVYRSEDGAVQGFQCRGHAGYAESGRDIVCAAVSVLVINTLNSIERFLPEDEMTVLSDEKEGLIECRFQQEPSEKCRLLLDTMFYGIGEIEKSHKGFVGIRSKRVPDV